LKQSFNSISFNVIKYNVQVGNSVDLCKLLRQLTEVNVYLIVIYCFSGGDMRKVLNILQSCAMAFDEVNEDNVYACVGHPLRSDVENVVSWMLNESFFTAYKNILDLKTLKGLSLLDLLTEVHCFVHRLELPQRVKIHLLIKMADVERRLLEGTTDKVQLGSLLAAFHEARKMVKEEAE